MRDLTDPQVDLASRKCIPCAGEVPPLAGDQLTSLMTHLRGWNLVGEHHLEKTFRFPDFAQALDFVNEVGRIAERENHHPYIHFTWGQVKVEVWTHKVVGLTENDFILAAKIDRIGRPEPGGQ